MAYDTLESAQARILELDDLVKDLTTERDSLSQDNKAKDSEIADLKTLNQKYFNRLQAEKDGDPGKPNEEDEPDIPTCEEFATDLFKKGF